jgi:hypothetical protein
MDFAVELLGNRLILENLALLDGTIVARAHDVLEEGATVGLQVAEDLCPVLTGFLRSRLDVEVEETSMKITNDTSYAAPVELGHVTRSGSFVPAQPFMVPGWIAAGDYVIEHLKELI